MKSTGVHLEDDLYSDCEDYMNKTGSTFSNLVRLALKYFLTNDK